MYSTKLYKRHLLHKKKMSYPHTVPNMSDEQASEWLQCRIDRLTNMLMASRIERTRERLMKNIAESTAIRDHLKDLSTGATTESVRFDKDGYIPRT